MTSAAAEIPVDSFAARPRGRVARLARGLVRQPVALGAGLLLVALFVAGLVVPSLVPYGRQLDLLAVNRAPTLAHWHLFGTNGVGQDVLQQTMQGLHRTEQIAVLGTLVSTLLGVAVGGLAGYRGGWMDVVLMRMTDVFGILPAIFILLVVEWYLIPVSALTQTLILAGCLWVPVARIVRAEIVSLRGREFAQAALALGASDTRIFFRHLLPNAVSTIIVAGTSLFGQLLLLEATVEFFGVDESGLGDPTLASLIGYGKLFGIGQGWGWWTWGCPALTLVLVIVCANLLGDGVAQALRPTARRS